MLAALNLDRFLLLVRVLTTLNQLMALQRILSRKLLVAAMTGIRLDSKMDPAVSLQVVIPVETLPALVALKRAVVGWAYAHAYTHAHSVHRVRRMPAVHLLHASHQPAIEARQKSGLRRAHQRHLSAGAVDIGHDRAGHRRKAI